MQGLPRHGRRAPRHDAARRVSVCQKALVLTFTSKAGSRSRKSASAQPSGSSVLRHPLLTPPPPPHTQGLTTAGAVRHHSGKCSVRSSGTFPRGLHLLSPGPRRFDHDHHCHRAVTLPLCTFDLCRHTVALQMGLTSYFKIKERGSTWCTVGVACVRACVFNGVRMRDV